MLNQMELKLLPTMELTTAVNELLEELNRRKAYILDWENPDMFLNHLEYHCAGGTFLDGGQNPARGDGSDNVYCFFSEVRKDAEEN